MTRTDPGVLTRLGRGYVYLVAGLPLGVLGFASAVAGLAAGAGTLVVGLGVPILVGTLAVARGFAGAERALAASGTGRSLPTHHYREPSGRGIGRLWSRLGDPQSWRDLLHAIVAFPLHVVTFVVAVVWGVTGVAGTVFVLWQWALPRGEFSALLGLLPGAPRVLGEIVLVTAAGVWMLLVLPLVMRLLVAAQAGVARGLLTSETSALRARAVTLQSSRRAAVAAEAQTLRRLERDIHDGPQQRLVRLEMDLETVARRLDDDPDRARPLVAEALVQSREALAELRALSRGIAPPILADRGLGPALAAAAARCPVEVALELALPDGRLAADVENTAYFVVTEALTNVAKHARASRCTVVVSADGERVLVQIRDDGRGGAHPGKGHGLAGLADRLAAVEGALDVVSPAGGPTVLTAEIPLVGVG